MGASLRWSDYTSVTWKYWGVTTFNNCKHKISRHETFLPDNILPLSSINSNKGVIFEVIDVWYISSMKLWLGRPSFCYYCVSCCFVFFLFLLFWKPSLLLRKSRPLSCTPLPRVVPPPRRVPPIFPYPICRVIHEQWRGPTAAPVTAAGDWGTPHHVSHPKASVMLWAARESSSRSSYTCRVFA